MSIIRILYCFLLIALISCSPLKQFRELPEVKAWETDISGFELLDRTESYPDDAILFAGSSSIRRWNTLQSDMAPFNVIQRGYGGAKLSDFAVYADRIFSPHKCNACVMFIANDITGSKDDKSPEEVKKLFLSVLKTFRKSHPDTPFFWIAVTPSSSRWKAWPQISRTNDLIMETCRKHTNTYFIRTDYAFLTDDCTPNDSLFEEDKLHLNPRGYEIWTKIIKGDLEKVIPPFSFSPRGKAGNQQIIKKQPL